MEAGVGGAGRAGTDSDWVAAVRRVETPREEEDEEAMITETGNTTTGKRVHTTGTAGKGVRAYTEDRVQATTQENTHTHKPTN